MFLTQTLTGSSPVQRPTCQKPKDNDSQQPRAIVVEMAVHTTRYGHWSECGEIKPGSVDDAVEDPRRHFPTRSRSPKHGLFFRGDEHQKRRDGQHHQRKDNSPAHPRHDPIHRRIGHRRGRGWLSLPPNVERNVAARQGMQVVQRNEAQKLESLTSCNTAHFRGQDHLRIHNRHQPSPILLGKLNANGCCAAWVEDTVSQMKEPASHRSLSGPG